MNPRLIFCEGNDDLTALRELIVRDCARSSPDPSRRFPGDRSAQEFVDADLPDVHLVDAKGKAKLPRRVVSELTAPSPGLRFDVIGVSFDPDAVSSRAPSEWVRTNCIPKEARTEETEHGWQVMVEDRTTEVITLAWHLGDVFDRLHEDEYNLERAALDVLAKGAKRQAAVVDDLLNYLQGKKIQTSWKTALKLWNAVRKPNTDGPGFLAQVFGQDPKLRVAKEALLRDTPLLAALHYICGASHQVEPTATAG